MPPRRRSPPKHRHDGTSPLPLGMDWSPPPKRWDGRDTVWPHDPCSGWSYCVTIPSWFSQSGQGLSDQTLTNPVVFYRVQIGVQSPEGVCTACVIHRRFRDFQKLYSDLKRAFPKKDIPQAPPKHALLRINSSRMLLEERRYALEEWMGKLLTDIDLSRSVQVASFFELEAAARSSFVDLNQQYLGSNANGNIPEKSTSKQILVHSGSGAGLVAPSTAQSVTSDCGSDNPYEASDHYSREHQNLSLKDERCFPTGMLSDLSLAPHGNDLTVESISDQLVEFSGDNTYRNNGMFRENSSENGAQMELVIGPEHEKRPSHVRKLSSESFGSDISSVRGSETSNLSVYNSPGDVFVDLSGTEAPGLMDVLDSSGIVLPLDQLHKLNRYLITLQRRLGTAKTDMEDLIARLNQEIAAKDYHMTKVKDLEVELEITKQRSRENLQQAIMNERERVTQMQWDMDELQRKCSEMESKLKIEENERIITDSVALEKETLTQELDHRSALIEILQKNVEDLELKSKSDIKVLGKEIKALRKSQAELKEMLQRSVNEKSELQMTLQKEKQRHDLEFLSRKKLIYECSVLHRRLQECSVNILSEEENKFDVNPSSLSETLDTLTTSDNRIGLLLAEAQLLAQEDGNTMLDVDKSQEDGIPGSMKLNDNLNKNDDEVKKILTDSFINNAKLQKHVNSLIRCALNPDVKSEKEDDGNTRRKSILNKYLER